MKFPRNARMLKGHLDFAPFASVFFCLLIFVLLASLVYTPGVKIHLTETKGNPGGVDGTVVKVAVYPPDKYYYENQLISARDLEQRLREAVRKYPEGLTLVVLADANLPARQELELFELARTAGITNTALGAQQGVFDAPTQNK